MLEITEQSYTNEDLLETFKVLTTKMKQDIRIEYDAGRLTGSQYAEVYLGSMTAALQGASQFLLAKDSAFYQRKLHEAEIKRIEAQTRLLDEELLQAKINTTIATETQDEQVALTENQLEQGIKQLGIMDSQMQTAAEQLTQAQIQTEILTATKTDSIELIAVQLKQQEDALAVSQERHGMNFKPAYTQE